MPRKPDLSEPLPVAPATGASLEQWLAYLEAVHPSEIDLGLDRVLVVLRRLFAGPIKGRVITVAGTNGKGSTVTCLEALLQGAGRTTGAYTSPHLSRYNERIRINGVEVDDGEIITAFEAIDAARRKVSLTYFEFSTLAAFLIMESHGVEDWILEVGLGGRLDAVNVLDAELAIITSVDIDHTAWLGTDRETIGFEKAGILRFGKPAIYADVDPPSSVLQQATAQKVPLLRYGTDYTIAQGAPGLLVDLKASGRCIQVPQSPLPETSVAAAVRAACLLQPDITDQIISDSLQAVRMPGRFELIHASPTVYADVGHNPHAARWLAGRLESLKAEGTKIFAVYGCLTDKDSQGVVSALRGVVDHWMPGGLSVARGVDAVGLAERLQKVLPGHGAYTVSNTVSEALDLALAQAGVKDIVIVFGSFFTVSQARKHLNVL
ncbi:MAG: bifunctional tetrahydrofolate synthase/dihydrofolate synthase [Marinobacter sp.]|uniref:bifunctional tetrahydrofolate synthase/dihydrofolate synthase n=1 Tax=Marinobacter sp. TaxID=50741 RepID=UPI00349FE433